MCRKVNSILVLPVERTLTDRFSCSVLEDQRNYFFLHIIQIFCLFFLQACCCKNRTSAVWTCVSCSWLNVWLCQHSLSFSIVGLVVWKITAACTRCSPHSFQYSRHSWFSAAWRVLSSSHLNTKCSCFLSKKEKQKDLYLMHLGWIVCRTDRRTDANTVCPPLVELSVVLLSKAVELLSL